ncbi:MAG: hypothetical protein ACLTUL_03075 [Blautia faecis]
MLQLIGRIALDNEVTFYKEDREEIRKLILKHKIVKRSDNRVKYERLIAVLLYLSRKMNMQTVDSEK